MKTVVIANCHVQPLTRGLATIVGGDNVLGIPIHQYGTIHFNKPEQEFLMLEHDADKTILTFNNGPQFGEYATERLIKKYKNALTMTNIHFRGLHPDIIYVGDRGGRITSPIGDYHSKIIVHSFMTGRSVNDCRIRFNELEYAERGFFSEYDKSATELLKRDESSDIAFGATFLEIIKDNASLFSVNHPTGYVFQEYIDLIASRLHLRYQKFPVGMLHNYLANSAWWPIYAEIGEEHGLKYTTPMLFRKPDALGGGFLDLQFFIEGSYDVYQRNIDRIQNSRQVLNLMDDWGK